MAEKESNLPKLKNQVSELNSALLRVLMSHLCHTSELHSQQVHSVGSQQEMMHQCAFITLASEKHMYIQLVPSKPSSWEEQFLWPLGLICLVAKCISALFSWADAGHLSIARFFYTHHTQMLSGTQMKLRKFYFQVQLSKIAILFKNHLLHLPRLKISFVYLRVQLLLSAKAAFSYFPMYQNQGEENY